MCTLAKSSSKIESLWYLAGHIYSCVRQLYKVRPGDPIKIATISVTADLPAPKIQRALLVLRQAPIWTEISGDLSKITALVTPSEGILGYKTLTDVVLSQSKLERRVSVESGNTSVQSPVKGTKSKLFIVHGHDVGTKSAVARFVEQLGFEAIILHEKPNVGRSIITKFREESEGAGFAIVLMTPDDLGKGASDLDGVLYISLDEANWRVKLGQELREAGFSVDMNKIVD